MSSAVEDSSHNVFHSLAALGQVKQSLKVISTTPKKIVSAGLLAKDKRGRTPLHLAAYYGNIKVLKVFLDACPEAQNVRDADGNNVRDALRRPEAPVAGDIECQKLFQRLVKIDKKGIEHFDFKQGPMDIWDVAISANTMLMVAEPTWGGAQSRLLFAVMKGDLQQLYLGNNEEEPRFVATSNVHSLVLTGSKCFAWGKNVNGVLGLDIDDKLVTEPTALDEMFVEGSQNGRQNAFSALGGHSESKVEVKEPLIGVSCCDFHSICYTTNKLWAWGVNRGQMGKYARENEIVDTPQIVFRTSTRIRMAKCCDNGVVILLSNGQVHLLTRGQTSRLQVGRNSQKNVEAIAASGNYVAIQTDAGKLLRYNLKSFGTEKAEFSTAWTPRHSKDEISSFDIGDNGSILVATKSSVFRLDDGREVVEFPMLRGMQFSKISTDAQFRNFYGVNTIAAGLPQSPEIEALQTSANYVRWQSRDHDSDMITFLVGEDHAPVSVHRAVLYARCPTLRPLCTATASKLQQIVATPGGSALFKPAPQSNTILVEQTPLASLQAFVQSLYYSSGAPSQPAYTDSLGTAGLELHEFNSLRRLITNDLGPGLWEARLDNIGCDVVVNSTHAAHSGILIAASPVFAAQLLRWASSKLDDPALTPQSIDDVLRYAYTMELSVFKEGSSEARQAERLFELSQVADELLMKKLSEECEQRLFEMLSFELILPFLQELSHSQGPMGSQLFQAVLDVVVRNLPYYISLLGEVSAEVQESIEKTFKQTVGTEPVDRSLADAFDQLKTQNTQILSTPKTGKKKRTESNSSPPSEPVTPSPASTPAPTPVPTPTPASAASSRKSTPTGSGWIQARGKRRTSSTTDRREDMATMLRATSLSDSGSTVATPSGTASAVPPQTTPTRLPLPKKSASPMPLSTSPASSSTASSSSASLLGSLPKLGSSPLPTLGSKAAQPSSSKTPRTRFGGKDKKKAQQFHDPTVFAETFEASNKSSGGGVPWKQKPKSVQTSSSVLQSLEQAEQINRRRLNGQSVWSI